MISASAHDVKAPVKHLLEGKSGPAIALTRLRVAALTRLRVVVVKASHVPPRPFPVGGRGCFRFEFSGQALDLRLCQM